MKQIENFPIMPIGRAIDLTNKICGDYKVLYRTTPNKSTKQATWLCQCINCNKYIAKTASVLQRGENKCDCQNDLTGKRFGRWTVLGSTDKRTKSRTIIWQCRCDCGNEKEVNGDTLRRNQSKSCGCLNNEKRQERNREKRLDLTGQRFGKLIAISPNYNIEGHTHWNCKCDCGNEVSVDLGNLRAGRTQSCGCTHSLNEEKIIKFLILQNKNFVYQHRFSDLPYLKFDFYVEGKYIIEFDGSQHFWVSRTGWDTLEHYQRTHRNDLIKNEYCFNHNIPIIRIPYDASYEEEDLDISTSRFVLTKENQDEYYSLRTKA